MYTSWQVSLTPRVTVSGFNFSPVRLWENRGEDGIAREKQLLIDFLCASAGGPLLYTGRDMVTSHRGMGITTGDWEIFIGHVEATLQQFELPTTEFDDVIGFVQSTRDEIVDP